jgi:hypothetical protein
MLRSAKDITGSYNLQAQDGEIGKVKDFLFNDLLWTIRYLVADTGGWLDERLVLISPFALGEPDWGLNKIPVQMSREKIEDSPPIEKDKPVSRQNESELNNYYAWPVYFTYGVDATHYAEMQLMAERIKMAEKEQMESENESEDDPHLRSMDEVTGYSIEATDKSIGHVEDFILEDKTWIVRYMVVDTRNWLPGKKVLVSPEWIKQVDWVERNVKVDMNSESVKNSPEFDPTEPVNRNYEVKLYDFYGRPAYWENHK